MWAAVINILSVEKSTQTFAKISNQDAKVWAILLLLRRKRSKEVFVTSWLSTVSTWLNLGDKRGSQPSGSEKKKKGLRSPQCFRAGSPQLQTAAAWQPLPDVASSWWRPCCSKPSQWENAMTTGRVPPLRGSGCLLIMLLREDSCSGTDGWWRLSPLSFPSPTSVNKSLSYQHWLYIVPFAKAFFFLRTKSNILTNVINLKNTKRKAKNKSHLSALQQPKTATINISSTFWYTQFLCISPHRVIL